MISQVLIDEIAGGGLGLTKGVNLFAEQASVGKCALVRTSYETDVNVNIPDLRQANVQVLVFGYAIEEGHALATDIVGVLEAMLGSYTRDSSTYTVHSVVVRNRPVFINYANEKAFSANLTFYFTVG